MRKVVFERILAAVFAGLASPAFAGAPICSNESGANASFAAAVSLRGHGRAPSSVIDSNGMTVIQLDPTMPTSGLKADGYDVVSAEEFAQYDPWSEPSPLLRDRLFAEAGVRPFIGRLDHLKKDMLFLRAQEDSLDQLSKRYPGVPRGVLSTLQQLINGEKGAQK
jgi:hypothetical protein